MILIIQADKMVLERIEEIIKDDPLYEHEDISFRYRE